MSERLGKLKQGANLSVEGFASRLGAKPNTVRDWLNQKVLPRASALRDIAHEFGVTVDWLLGVDGAQQYRNQQRSGTELADDFARTLERLLAERLPPTLPAGDDEYRWLVDGPAAVLAAAESLVPIAQQVRDAHENARRMQQTNAADWDAIHSLLEFVDRNARGRGAVSPEFISSVVHLTQRTVETTEGWSKSHPAHSGGIVRLVLNRELERPS